MVGAACVGIGGSVTVTVRTTETAKEADKVDCALGKGRGEAIIQ